MRKSAPTSVIVAGVIILALGGSAPAEADLVARVIHSIKHPQHHRAVHRKKSKVQRKKPAVQPVPAATPEVSSVRPGTLAKASPPPPRPIETRAAGPRPVATPAAQRSTGATSAPAAAASKTEAGGKLLAGIPVPDKQGFLRSPYTDNQAVIDVRGFPSGTQVVDPATGRTFVTP